MSSPLAASNGLELLDRLHDVLAKFKQEEGDLARRAREKKFAIQRASAESIENAEQLLSGQSETAETFYAEEKTRLDAIHRARTARIRTLANTGLRSTPKRAREAGEHWLGELQMGHFVTSKRLQAERKAAEKAHERFLADVSRFRPAIAKIERRAKEYFLAYPGFLAGLRAKPDASPGDRSAEELLAGIEERMAATERSLAEFRALLLPKIFSLAPWWAVIPLIGVAVFIMGSRTHQWAVWGGLGVFAAAGWMLMHRMGAARSRDVALAAVGGIVEVRGLIEACEAAGIAAHEATIARIDAESENAGADVGNKWERAEEIRQEFETRETARFEKRLPRALARNDRMFETRRAALESSHATRMENIRRQTAALRNEAESGGESAFASAGSEEERAWSDLRRRWTAEIEPIYAEIAAMNSLAAAEFPEWSRELVDAWKPPIEFHPTTKFARLDVEIPPGPGSAGSQLELPGPSQVSIPLALTYPEGGSLLFEVNDPVGTRVISCLNQVILRLLATTPPGKLSFTILDPVGLGQNFAGLMHLGDYEESLISRRIWTQSDQIDARLGELNQHIEKIIQMYLRDEYPTIVEYNEQAGSTAEKYHFLVIADFPANFSETAIKRLQSIITSGPRCGVYTLVHWDKRLQMPSGFVADELRGGSVCIQGGRSGLSLENHLDAHLVLDAAPEPDIALEFVQKVGVASTDSNQVQVPFTAIAPTELWKGDTTNELRVAIGRTGATKQQMLAIGKGTRQHALLAGKTGSGKSTLFHVMITNLALACSPEQVEFYLIDFKKGVEFKCYADKKLPHARVIAIESDREFGLSVLQRVDEELRRRGDLFRKLGVQDIPGYKRSGGTEAIPRTLLVVDEFQELFVEDDAIAQNASMLLDRIVRQGRAFGIHVLLGSQTLGGAYSLARATLGQMVIRIALQCNEADAYLIMDDSNPAPRLLSRPGEGIYNDAAGAIEGNSPFQVCWLGDDERDGWLDKVRAEAERHPALDSTPIVFEGNAPAAIAENELLAKILRTEPKKVPTAPRAWIGAPNSIKGPTEVVFHRQSGNNLLIVGQRDETALAMMGNSLLALGAQYPAGTAKFVLLHQAVPGSADAEYIECVIAAMPHEVTIAGGTNLAEIMDELATELKRRVDGEPVAQETFLFVHGLQRFKKLRAEDDFGFSTSEDTGPKPGAQFGEIVSEGSAYGIHIITSVDTFNSVNRFLSRKALGEFEMRVVFQMSANDSAALIDSPKAGDLGLHRALFYNEQEGTLETFRPYATPDAVWLSQARRSATV